MLLADKPSALDSQTTEEILSVFAELNNNGITTVVRTHEQEVGDRAQRIIWFQGGRIYK